MRGRRARTGRDIRVGRRRRSAARSESRRPRPVDPHTRPTTSAKYCKRFVTSFL